MKAEPLHDIIDFLSLNGHDLLDTITACCTTLGSNNAYIPGPLIVCLTPDHAMMLKKDGYTKEMIQEHIHKYVYHQNAMVNGRGGHSGVILPWTLHSEGCVEALTLPDGTKAKSINDFKKK
jgi:hypothetical protein